MPVLPCPHMETSQFIFTANQLTCFYMKATLAFNGLNFLEKINVENFHGGVLLLIKLQTAILLKVPLLHR